MGFLFNIITVIFAAFKIAATLEHRLTKIEMSIQLINDDLYKIWKKIIKKGEQDELLE